jgi:two-component system nitrogen regulation response regulator NtrX
MNAKILVVDDEPDIRALVKDILEDEGYQVDVAEHALQADERKARFMPDLVLLDIWMPDTDGVSLLKQWSEQNTLTCPVVMMSGHGTVETAVEATRYGAFDFVEKPLSMARLLRTVKSALSSIEAQSPVTAAALEEPVGNSRQMQDLRNRMQSLAQNLAPVFLTASPGSGASLWADYLFSLRAEQVARHGFQGDLNLYSRGLPGNVYIEEVCDLSLHSQRVLLSLLRQGGSLDSNGRFVVVSQHSYDELRNDSRILQDLAEFWRDAVYIPTLDERIEDIPELLEYYVNWFSEREALPYRHFGVAAQNMIRNHGWHGGLTELKGFIKRLLSNSDADSVDLAEIRGLLPGASMASSATPTGKVSIDIDLDLDMRQAREVFEREYLRKQLELSRYNISELARKVGQERTNLYRKLKQLGLHSTKSK